MEAGERLTDEQKQTADLAHDIEVVRPDRQTAPVIFASPHSGRRYPEEFICQSRLSAHHLRRSEDAFVDEIFAAAPDHGAPFLRAHFPRAYVDANRHPWELDPGMFSEPLPDYVTTSSPRIAAGLGTVPKIVANGATIYSARLSFADARQRIRSCHLPYHDALTRLISDTTALFGGCLLVDCHSMPSSGSGRNSKFADIVIGDGYGKSCSREIVGLVVQRFRDFGYSVALNKPYAGGYTTRHYGRPLEGVHAFQIEISRALYMDETRIERRAGLDRLTGHASDLIAALSAIDPELLSVPLRANLTAAE